MSQIYLNFKEILGESRTRFAHEVFLRIVKDVFSEGSRKMFLFRLVPYYKNLFKT